MTVLYELFTFFISLNITVYYLFNAVVPLFYIPFVLYKIIKKEYRKEAILLCLIAPILWTTIWIVIVFVLQLFGLSEVLHWLFWSRGAAFGAALGIINVLLNMFSAQARQEFIMKLNRMRVNV